MWGPASNLPGAMYGAPAAVPQLQPTGGGGGSGGGGGVRHDIFVGNLAFNTTEDQLHQAFSEIGRVINVRLVTDMETGKPKGFAFIEYQDPQAALAAIRNMNDYELNGRRLRVNFSNSSHLEVLANKLGMDLTAQQAQRSAASSSAAAASSAPQGPGGAPGVGPGGGGTNAVADALKNLSKAEMYDVVAKLKEVADRDPDEARRILSGHPQLPEALLFLMSKLDMVRTPVPADMMALPMALLPAGAAAGAATAAPAAPARVDPRAAMRADPRQKPPAASAAPAAPQPPAAAPAAAAAPPARIDPRQRADPRARPPAAAAPLPPAAPPSSAAAGVAPMGSGQAALPGGGAPPPPPPSAMPVQPPLRPGMPPQIDPGLVAQVMALTPQQIAMLPPDQQQSILQLRQRITGGG